MIVEKIKCRQCNSEELVRNGSNGSGNPKYKCKECGYSGAIKPKRWDDSFKEQVVKAYQEKSSSRGVGRIFGISHNTVLKWAKKKP